MVRILFVGERERERGHPLGRVGVLGVFRPNEARPRLKEGYVRPRCIAGILLLGLSPPGLSETWSD